MSGALGSGPAQRTFRPTMRRTFFRLIRWLLLLVALGLVAGGLLLHLGYNNEALAKRLTERFNRDRRGHLEIESVHWGPQALWALVVGGTTRVTVTGLQLRDSRGRTALETRRAELVVSRRWSCSSRGTSRSSRSGPIRGGSRSTGMPGPMAPPLPASPRRWGSWVPWNSAERPARRPGGCGPPLPSHLSSRAMRRSLTIGDLRMSGITARLSQGADSAVLRDLSLRGDLSYSARGQGPDALTLNLQAAAPRGLVRVRRREVPFDGLRLAGRSDKGSQAGTIGVTGALRVEGAPVSLKGQIQGVPFRRHPTVRLALHAQRLGPVLSRLLHRPIREEDSRLILSLIGPTNALAAKARLAGLAWDSSFDAPQLLSSNATYSEGMVLLESASIRAWGGAFMSRDGFHGRRDAGASTPSAPPSTRPGSCGAICMRWTSRPQDWLMAWGACGTRARAGPS